MPKQSPLSVSRIHSPSDQALLKKYHHELKRRFKKERVRLEKKGYSKARISEKLADEDRQESIERVLIQDIKTTLAFSRVSRFLRTRNIEEKEIESVLQSVRDNMDHLTVGAIEKSVLNIETLLLNKNYSSKQEKEELVKQVKELLEPYAEEMMELKELRASNRRLEEEIKREQASTKRLKEGVKQLQDSNQRWQEKMDHERASTKYLQKEMKEVHAYKLSLLARVSSLDQRAQKLLDGTTNAPEKDAKQWPSKRALLPSVQVPPTKKIRSAAELDSSHQEHDGNDSSVAHTPFPKA